MPRRKKLGELGKGRAVVKISLTTRANESVTKWLDLSGGSKQAFMEKLLEFFGSAPDSVQQMMVSSVPVDLRKEFAQKASEHFLSLGENSDDPLSRRMVITQVKDR